MSDESITNLSWLLEQVAKRLDELADGIRAEEKKGISFSASAKTVQEALLHALSSSGGDKPLEIEKIVALLKISSDTTPSGED